MANNPIKYNDLFDPDVKTELDGLKGQLKEVQNALQGMIETTKASAGEIKKTLNSNTGGSSSTVAGVQEVYEAYEKMKVQLSGVTAELKKLEGESSEVAFTQKEINKVVKLGNEYNAQRGDSYAQLSKKYSAMKILINQLTQAERENTEEGKALVNQSREIYEQMNRMQQATGKYQLQVGNYSKALGGLQLATNQVIRELPVMANGLSMFVMAISNNIPILLDNIQMFRMEQAQMAKEGKASMSVFQGMAKSIFSWQTAIIVLLSVMPAIIKKIKERREEQKKLNDAIKEGSAIESAYYSVKYRTRANYIDTAATIRQLYQATQDENRSMEERIRIGKILLEQFPEEFRGFDAESIALGKAKDKYEELTTAMLKHTRAKAISEEIVTQEKAIIDSEKQIEKIKETIDVEGILKDIEQDRFNLELAQDEKNKVRDRDWEAMVERRIAGRERELKTYNDEMKKIEEARKAITWLRSQMDSSDFSSLFSGGKGKSGGEEGVEIPDIPALNFFEENNKYFRQAWKAEIELMEDSMDKELALNDYKYQTMLEDLSAFLGQQELLEKDGRNTISTEQMQWIRETLETLKSQYYDQMTEIQKKWLTKQAKLGVDIPGLEKKKSWFTKLLGFEDEKDFRKYLKGLERVINLTFKYMHEWMDMRIEMAHIAVEAAEKETNATKEALDLEQQARVNGYAHNVGLARREYQERLQAQKEAMAEEQRLAKIQQQIDTAQQVSSLLVATANLWANFSKMGIPGIVLAGIATAGMFGAFAAAQIKAAELVKVKQYGEGMSEYLDYGGSHASGNDIDFGTMKDGTRRRVERGEMVAVINKRNVSKYGADNIASIMASLNSGTFEDRYGLAFAGMSLASASTDLSKVEEGIGTLVRQGEKRIVHSGNTTIEYYKNRKRIIRN